jgi:very-short-patch-repair endonuclease
VPTRRLLLHLPEDQHGATRSLLEDLLLDLHRDKNLPMPEINAVIDGRECDFSFPSLRLIIEADGWETHRTRIAFEDDHDSRLDLEANGRRVIAVTYRQMTIGRERTAARLERIIRGLSGEPVRYLWREPWNCNRS